jgi:hypothetical protein
MHKITPTRVLSVFHKKHRIRAAHPSRRTGSERERLIKRAHDKRLDLKLRVQRLKLLLPIAKGRRKEGLEKLVAHLTRERDIAQKEYERLLSPHK